MRSGSDGLALPVTDRAAITRTTLLGILGLSVALVAAALLDPTQLGLGFGRLLAISAVDIALTAGFAFLPWRRLYERGIAERLTGAYILAIATLPIAAVLLGMERPSRLVWFAPLIVAISAFLTRTAFHVGVTGMMLLLLWLVVRGRPVEPFDLVLRVAVILTIAVVSGATAALWRRSVAREQVYRADAERRADLLSTIGTATASLSAEGRSEVLQTLTSAASSLGGEMVAVWLGDELEPAAVAPATLPDGVAGALRAEAREATTLVRVDDCLVEDRYLRLHAETDVASLLVVPITAGDERVGALVAASRKPSAFDDDAVETLQLLTSSGAAGLRLAGPPDDAEVLAVLSHELRAPVTAIAGLSETVELRWAESDDAVRRTLLQRIRSNATALDTTLGAMRALVQLEHHDVEIETVDVATLVETTVERLEPVLTGHVVVRHVEAPAVARTSGALVERVVENLLTNARRHTPPGTRITVGVTSVAGGIAVSVADDGPGIDPESLARVRAPYVHGERSPGLGLGLSLCDRILARLGSQLRMDSVSGSGSRFTFVLPAADGPA